MRIAVEHVGKTQVTDHMKFRKITISVKRAFRRVRVHVIYEVHCRHNRLVGEVRGGYESPYFVDNRGFRLNEWDGFYRNAIDTHNAIDQALKEYRRKIARNEERQLFLQSRNEAVKAETGKYPPIWEVP